MNVAIILYSGTGNTRGVAEQLVEELGARGNEAEIREITITGDPSKGTEGFQLVRTPSMQDADLVILASPVMAFSLSPVMKAYLDRADAPSRPVRVLITQHFPRAWMGGTQALGWIRRALERRGGSVADAVIVNWTGRRREQQIREGIERLAASRS